MSVLDRARLVMRVMERAVAVVQRRRRELWLAEPEERPPVLKGDDR